MGLFGAIGRESKGALRSLSYDLQHSRHFRKVGVIAVATVAGGVLAAGTLLRGPLPGMVDYEPDEGNADIADGWFGIGADTTGQAPESETADTQGAQEDLADDEQAPEGGKSTSHLGSPESDPDLDPIEKPSSSNPGEEESDEAPTTEPEPSDPGSPSEEPTTDEPTGEDPTSETPSDEPTSGEPTSDEPTSDRPTSEEPTETESPTGEPEPTSTGSEAPEPSKSPVS